MTAGDMLSFAIHSPTIFRALGFPENDPAFRCWLTHLNYLSICLQHQISEAEVTELDQLIRSHHSQLRSIPAYDGIWKPKNHFACHFALNIRRFGPPRHYWCMRFEALNQVFKKIAVGGSYRDTCGRCARFYTIRAARLRKSGAYDHWGETRAQLSTVTTYLGRSEEPAPAAVQWLFEHMYPSAQSLSLAWAGSLYHQGTELLAGMSWVRITLEGSSDIPLFGYVREIFSLNGQLSLFLAFYPSFQAMAGGQVRCEWQQGYSAPTAVTPLLQIQSLDPLWPVSEQIEGGKVSRIFVRC